MINKHLAFGLALGLIAGAAFAEENATTPAVAPAAEVSSVVATTTATSATDDARRTSISAMMAKNFSEDKIQARWKAEEKLYQDAGISEDKIKKLHDLNVTTWKAMGAGEKTDYQGYIRERNAILTPEEMQKLRTTQREAIAKRTSQKNATTTSTAN